MSYCKYCGSKELERPTGYFDIKTGKAKTKVSCQNKSCWNCEGDGSCDHSYGLLSNRCRKCGFAKRGHYL